MFTESHTNRKGFYNGRTFPKSYSSRYSVVDPSEPRRDYIAPRQCVY